MRLGINVRIPAEVGGLPMPREFEMAGHLRLAGRLVVSAPSKLCFLASTREPFMGAMHSKPIKEHIGTMTMFHHDVQFCMIGSMRNIRFRELFNICLALRGNSA